MATKKRSFRELYGNWSAAESRRDQDRNDPRNRQAQGEAILNQLIADGEDISDDKYGEMLGQYMTTGNMQRSAPAAPVESAAPVLPVSDTPIIPDAQMSAITAEEAYNRTDYNPVQAVRDMGASLRSSAKRGLADTMESVAPLVNFSTRLSNYALAKTGLGPIIPQARTPEFVQEEADRLRTEAGEIPVSDRARVARELRSEERGFFGELGMMARNPSILPDIAAEQAGVQLASTPGLIVGPFGMVGVQAAQAAGNSGDQAYNQVLAEGGTELEAEQARATAAGLSFTANAAVPTLTPRGTALEELLSGTVGRSAGRSVVRNTLAPYIGETASETVSEALDAAAVNVATGDEWTDGLGQAAAQGFAIGQAGAAAPAYAEGREASRAKTRREFENTRNILKGAVDNAPVLPEPTAADKLRERGRKARENLNNLADEANVDRELYWAQRDAERNAARAADFSKAEQEQNARRSLEEEAGFQTIERDADLPDSRVERYADVVERVPVNPPAEVTPEQVQEQRDAAAQAERDSARVKEINSVAARRESISKKAAAAKTAEEKKAQAASRAQRTKAIDELLTANPQATDAEIADMLPAKLAAIAVQPKPVSSKAPAKKAAKKAVKKAAAPKVVPAKVTESPFAKMKASSDPTDRFAAEAAEKLGLGMAAKDAKTTTPFVQQAKKIGKALAGNTSKQAAAAEKLLADGRLIVAPNATSVGREELGRVGEYDTGTGKLYVYADSLSDDVIADLMEAASHETGHSEQMSDADGRGRSLESLVGKQNISSAANKIRAAAKKGNKLAQEAVAAAQADTAARTERGEENPSRWEDHEIGAYLIGGENRGRASTLGQAAGGLRDLVAGAKEMLRTRVGANLDVTVNDLRSAAGKVLESAASRPATTQAEGESLGMVAGRNATNAKRAEAEGKFYQIPGHPESKSRWEFSDSEAELNTDNLADAVDGKIQSNMALPAAIAHKQLFQEYPQLRNYSVELADLAPATVGRFHRGAQKIELNSNLVKAALNNPNEINPISDTGLTNREFLRNVLLHEVQHAVQEIEGFTGGASYNAASVNRARDARNNAMQEYNDYITMWSDNLPDAVALLSENAREQWNEIVADTPKLSPVGEARMFLEYGMGDFLPAGRYKTSARRFAEVDAKKNAAHKAFLDAKELASENYVNVHGEIEARNTEFRSRMTDEELQADPAVGTYDVPVSKALGEGRGTTRGPVERRGEEAFDTWFGDSVITNDDGTPKVMYTGTSKDTNFTSFKMPKNGVWFTSDPASASQYAVENDSMTSRYEPGRGFQDVNSASRVFPVYLKVENPYTVTKADYDRMNVQNYKKAQGQLFDELRAQGYDGVIWPGSSNVVVIQSPTQIKSVNNSGKFSDKSKDVLGMQVRNQQVTPPSWVPVVGGQPVKYGTFLTALLRNDKGLGKKIRNAKELAQALPAVYEAQANAAVGSYDSALKKLAAEQGTTAAELNAEIEKTIEALYDMEGTPSEYAAAFNEAMDKYGKAGDALKRLRQLNTDLSKEILRTYIDQGSKLSESEKKEVGAIAANLGRYTHRFYAAKQGRGLGKTYSDAVMKAVENKSKGKKLTPKQKDLFDIYTRAAKKIGDDVVIPDEDNIGDLNADQIDYLDRTWHGQKNMGLDTDGKIAALLETREQYGAEDIKNKTDEAMQGLLYGIEGVADSYYNRGGKINTGILQKRSKMPKEIRELLGEITDPATVLLVTASKQAELVARTRMLIDFKNNASPDDLQPAGLGRDYAKVRENNMTPLTGDGYGPLEGMYASPAMHAMIDDTRASLMNFQDAVISGADSYGKAGEALGTKMANLWMKGAATSKSMSIVGNLFRYGLNGLGALSMPLFNGNTNLDTYQDGLRDAVSLIRYAHTPGAGLGSAENAVKYRVVDSATVGDLKLLDLGKVEKLVKQMAGKGQGTPLRIAKKIGMTLRETYAMMDVWAKIANFHYEAEHLERMYKAANVKKTQDEIYQEASDIVSSTNIGYNRAMPAVKALERIAFTRFGPYMYDVMRIQATNAYQGLKEMTYTAAQQPTAAAKGLSVARGATRLAGQAAVLGMWTWLSSALSGMWGDDEDDKRALLPDFSQVQDFTEVGFDAEGKPVLYAVSQVDPIEPFTAMIRAARMSDEPLDAVWDQFKELYIAPALAPLAMTTAKVTASNVLGNDVVNTADEYVKNPLLQEWAPNGYGILLTAANAAGVKDRTLKSWNNLLESVFVPGTMRAWTANNPVVESFPEDGRVAAIGYNVGRAMGARGVAYNPETGAKQVGYNYGQTIRNTRLELNEFVANRPNATSDQIISQILALTAEEKAAWDQVARVRRGMIAVGMSETDADAMLKTAKVPVEVINQIGEETFSPRTVDQQSFSAAATKAINKKKSEKEKSAEQAKWENAWEVLQDIEGEE